MKFSIEELKFLSELLLSYIEELVYTSDEDISEIPEFEFCDILLTKLNKKIYKNKGTDSINLILRRN
jgi:hypothetical protein